MRMKGTSRGCVSRLLLLWLLFPACSFGATTIAVPADQPTIQTAIDFALNGDTITVAPGTYLENLNFKGKAIKLVSLNGAAATIIDGGINTFVLTFHQLETRATIVSGFTIKNGVGSFGKSVESVNSSPTLTDNVFQGSVGVSIDGFNSSMLLQRNLFTGWVCPGGPGNAIVSFVNNSSPSVKDNVFANNKCPALDVSLPYGNVPDVSNNTFVHNDVGIQTINAASGDGQMYRNNLLYDNGVGILVYEGHPEDYLRNNLVYGNTINYQGIADQTGINGNMSMDPLLGGLGAADYHVDEGSPAIDAGVNVAVNQGETDFYSAQRIRIGQTGNSLVDVGAAEYVGLQPSASLSISTNAARLGDSVTLTWSSSKATSCAANGAWSGPLALVGSKTIKPTAGNLNYEIVCTNAAASRGASVSLTVYPPPTVSLTLLSASIFFGEGTTLSWSSTNANSCTKSGAWMGVAPTSGTLFVGPATGTYQYVLTCAGLDGTATASATLVVLVPGDGVPQRVDLSSVANVYDIAATGTNVPEGGLDGNGYAYAKNLIGAFTWSGANFDLGGPGAANATANSVIPLPGDRYVGLTLLATGVHGNQVNQTFIVTYTDGSKSSFTQSVSDWHTPQTYPGEYTVLNMDYRVTPSGATQAGKYYIYGYRFALDSSKIVRSLTLPSNRQVVALGVDVTPAPPAATVDLYSIDNIYGIAAPGQAVPSGGLDGMRYAYAADLLGYSVTWANSIFDFWIPGQPNAATSETIPLRDERDVSVSLLATGVSGNQANQTFIITYRDGSKTSFSQGMSDWYTPQRYPGESIALSTTYRVAPTGATQRGPYNVYGYTFALDSSKRVQSLTLPSNRKVVVLAVDQTLAPPAAPVAMSSIDNVYAVGASGKPVPGGGVDGTGYAYSADLFTSMDWTGDSFAVGGPAQPSAFTSGVIPLPSGKDVRLRFLATGVHGNQVNQNFVVTYTDGSKTSFTQSLSDWHTSQTYAGESIALSTEYRITPTGATQSGSYNVYGYTLVLDSSKTVLSLTLPSNPRVVIFAVDVTPATGFSGAAASQTLTH